jgi:DNA helicase II / ATP-dependent DNA helicase PcrA
VTYPTQRDEADDIAAQIAREVRPAAGGRATSPSFTARTPFRGRFEHALRDHILPYQIVNGLEFYQRKEIKDVMAYLQLLNNPAERRRLSADHQHADPRIGKATINKLADYARQRGLPLLEAARQAGLVPGLGKAAGDGLCQVRGDASTGWANRCTIRSRSWSAACSPRPAIARCWKTASPRTTKSGWRTSRNSSPRPANSTSAIRARDTLEQFLEESSLVADTDAWEAETDKVTLMTLHAAKGLEFPVVFIVAVEEGLLPHERSRHDEEKLEEERRLLFVGITRARDELQLSYAQYRYVPRQNCPTVPSPFLMELPRHEMDQSDSFATDSTTARRTTTKCSTGMPTPAARMNCRSTNRPPTTFRRTTFRKTTRISRESQNEPGSRRAPC